ncbi:hypothetical protein NDU88_002290 [Pleurodeles waltl]|uniref:Uncharacterized protein n=1 Tax=Pleurodeles waltl TaxID=8319 RepID=A0AAV7Q5J9_PLEWA|nr:hypothetical protein NDU88_002290 [Pleurodeles waltl]
MFTSPGHRSGAVSPSLRCVSTEEAVGACAACLREEVLHSMQPGLGSTDRSSGGAHGTEDAFGRVVCWFCPDLCTWVPPAVGRVGGLDVVGRLTLVLKEQGLRHRRGHYATILEIRDYYRGRVCRPNVQNETDRCTRSRVKQNRMSYLRAFVKRESFGMDSNCNVMLAIRSQDWLIGSQHETSVCIDVPSPRIGQAPELYTHTVFNAFISYYVSYSIAFRNVVLWDKEQGGLALPDFFLYYQAAWFDMMVKMGMVDMEKGEWRQHAVFFSKMARLSKLTSTSC